MSYMTYMSYIYIYIHIFIYIYIYIYIHICVYACECVYVCVCTCIYIYIYIYVSFSRSIYLSIYLAPYGYLDQSTDPTADVKIALCTNPPIYAPTHLSRVTYLCNLPSIPSTHLQIHLRTYLHEN